MAEKVRDYAKLAHDIFDTVGGKENIVDVTHCATRLRLVLKETPVDAQKKIASMTGVITVVDKAGQFQVVIGTHVVDVYDEFSKNLNLNGKVLEQGKQQGILNRIIATFSAIFVPFVYVLAGCGLMQSVLVIITMFNADFKLTGVYQVISLISKAPFTYMPILIAVSAAKYFKCNIYVAVTCCLALVGSQWANMAGQIKSGEEIKFLFIKLFGTSYTGSVIPAILLVFVLSRLERFLRKCLPDLIKEIGTAFLSTLIMVTCTIIIIGPVTQYLSDGIAVSVYNLFKTVPVLAYGLMGGIYQVMVVFGVQWGVIAMRMQNFATLGYDYLMVTAVCSIFAQTITGVFVAIKSKNKQFKNDAFSASLNGFFGVTEPAIYGVNLRLKKPFVYGCIAGAIGSIVAGLFGSLYYVNPGISSIFSIVAAINPDDPNSFLGVVFGIIATAVISFILVNFVGFEEPVSDTEN